MTETPGRGRRDALREWGIGLAVAAAIASTLGLSQSQLAARQAQASVRQIARDRGVPLRSVQRAARAAAEPQLEAAVAAGDITESDLRQRLRRIDARVLYD
jgi:hypothetical protein